MQKIIKFIKCGKDKLGDIIPCPFCGHPFNIHLTKTANPDKDKAVIEYDEKVKTRQKVYEYAFVIFIITALLVATFFLLQSKLSESALQEAYINNLYQGLSNANYNQVLSSGNIKEIPLQKVDNLGYIFFIGQADYPGTPAISDSLKNDITKIVYNAHFSKDLLLKTPIIFLNNLALTKGQYVPTLTGNLNIPELKPEFLSEGGIYSTYNDNQAVIYINKPIVEKKQLPEVLTHELGHAIGNHLSENDWDTFYKLRNIPPGTMRTGAKWNLSPKEDFAEVYKNIYTGKDIKTYYGALSAAGAEITCQKIFQGIVDNYIPQASILNDQDTWYNSIWYDTKKGNTDADDEKFEEVAEKALIDSVLQDCRRNVMFNPSKYPEDWEYMTPYKSNLDQKTKDFVTKIVDSL